MTENLKKEQPKEPQTPQKRIFGEARGKYSLIDGQKVFHFDFPINSTLEENLAAMSFIKDEVLRSIQEKEKAEKEKKEVVKEDKKEEKK